ncbi:MAG: glycosyltransferase family 39 protein, partial [Anaerolineae bacterium]
LRFWRLDAIPPGFHYDEAYEALEAWRVITQPGYHPIFFPGNFGVEPMFIYLTALAFRLFGETPTVMRGVAAVIGTLTVPALFGLGRELALNDRRFPRSAAWLAALALAIMRWHITFSRVGIEPILVPLFLVWLLWAFWHGRRTGRAWAWAAAGAAAGAGVYVYPAARLLPILLALLSLLALIAARGAAAQGEDGRAAAPRAIVRGLIVAWLAAVLVALPMAWHWWQHPDQLLLRSSQIAVGAGDATRGSPLRNLLASLGMFIVRGDRDPRSNVPGMPAFDLLIGVPFMIGVGVALWRWKRPVFASLLLAGGLMLAPTIFSEHAPHFRRTIGEAPVAALFIGLGLAAILGRRTEAAPATAYVPATLAAGGWEPAALAGQMDRLRWWGRAVAVAAILAGSATYSAIAYFDVWGGSNALFYAYDEGLWEIGRYVLGLKDGTRIFLSPRPATDMTLAFAWRNGPAVRRFDGRHAFIAPQGEQPATYIIIDHEDFRGAMLLRDLYPDARLARAFYDRHGRGYARAFWVPRPGHIARRPQTPLDGRWPAI